MAGARVPAGSLHIGFHHWFQLPGSWIASLNSPPPSFQAVWPILVNGYHRAVSQKSLSLKPSPGLRLDAWEPRTSAIESWSGRSAPNAPLFLGLPRFPAGSPAALNHFLRVELFTPNSRASRALVHPLPTMSSLKKFSRSVTSGLLGLLWIVLPRP